MAKTANTLEINHSEVPIRLFKSDFLEFFTHIHPAVVVMIWLPVSAFFMWRAITSVPAGASWAYIPIGFVLGVFLWTLAEYVGHRFSFITTRKASGCRRSSSRFTACTMPSRSSRHAW